MSLCEILGVEPRQLVKLLQLERQRREGEGFYILKDYMQRGLAPPI